MSVVPTLPVPNRSVPVWAGVALVLGLVAAYSNSFSTPFVFDDVPSILENPAIRDPAVWRDVLLPAGDGGLTLAGRPVVSLSLALNHALSGEAVWSYHVVNLLIHLCAALLLAGIVRRTLESPGLRARYGSLAGPLAVLVAALWSLHPLQTESVTYIVQRAESLVGLFYLLCLYAFIRWTESSGARRWLILSVGACFLGMATKEVMATVPLLTLLYDRTFVAGSFGAAWRRRGKYYLGLAASWLLLAWLIWGTGGRGGTVGFATTVSSWSYLLTQCRALGIYLWLGVWPVNLVFDYGTGPVAGLAQVWPQAMLIVLLLVATGYALWRNSAWGFLGAWFFVILAPSSSVIPVASQVIAEHRMYLPLAALVVALVAGLHRVAGRQALIVSTVLALAGGALTFQRNFAYHSELTLWADTVAKFPANARAHNNLGKAQFAAGQTEAALLAYGQSARVDPTAPEPHNNRGLALVRAGRLPEAIAAYAAALRLRPRYAEAENNLAGALLATGQAGDACVHYARAVEMNPAWAEAHSNYANALLDAGRPVEAVAQAEYALRLQPRLADAHYNLGNALAQTARLPEALEHFREAVRLQPANAGAWNNQGNVLLELDRPLEAIPCYQRALELSPALLDARRNLAFVLANLGRGPEAISQFELLLRQQPGDRDAAEALAGLRAQAGEVRR